MKSQYKRSAKPFGTHQSANQSPCFATIMKILILLCLVALSMSHPALIQKEVDSDTGPQDSVILQESTYSDAVTDDKKIGKRSYGWGGWPIAIHSVGWPWYGGHGWSGGIGHGGWSGIGHGWLGGWGSHGWPIILPSYGHGWHSKW